MLVRLLICFCSLLVIHSCDHKSTVEEELQKLNIKLPIVVDTFKSVPKNQVFESQRMGEYSPIYIGKSTERIFVSLRPDLEKYSVSRNKYKTPASLDILLIVDTSKIISNYTYDWEEDDLLLKPYKAYRVFIVNRSSDTLNVACGRHLPIIMEAFDKGDWRAIESPYMYACGTNLKELMLPPNELAVTSAPIYEGSFKTKLRLRYYNTLSQEFNGAIHLTQFENKRD